MRRNKQNIGIVVALVVIVLCVVLSALYAHGTKETIEIVVTDKERIVERSGESVSSKYLVFTESETFECTDSLWHLKYDSSDQYGRMQEGKKYMVTVYGWRLPFSSTYRNIVTVQHLE